MGAGANTADMLAAFGTAQAVWSASQTARAMSGAFTPRQLTKMRDAAPKDFAPLIRACAAKGWEILTPESGNYPPLLRAIGAPPLALFCQGESDVLRHPMPLGVVGTRNVSYRSRKIANRLCVSLAGAGALIVSGGALGVDSAAHEGALAAGAKTVAVLGTGLDARYLMENAPLRQRISQSGVLITEFVPGSQGRPQNFPIRNRIISGMSRGVLVIEAGERSGSLITAGQALEQGRDVFAVPGDISTSTNNGSNKLIREGAKAVFSAFDVLEDYALRYPGVVDLARADTVLAHAPDYIPPKESPRKKTVRKKGTDTTTPVETVPQAPYTPYEKQPREETLAPSAAQTVVSADACSAGAQRVFALLGDEAQGADALARTLASPIGEVMAALTELELFGAAQRVAGNAYLRGKA
jgi:DNA processing protein